MKHMNDKEYSVRCGKSTDDFSSLVRTCKNKAEELLRTMEIPSDGSVVSVPFWTSDFPAELIGVGVFRKDANGTIFYEFDTSETTL